MTGIGSSATSVVIGYLAAGTSSIRLGAGGIMLPNHSPLIIAEQFGTLASLFPGRIDLGLGRAPGTDQLTAAALRRNLNASVEDFPRDVMQVQALLDEPEPSQRVLAVPGYGTRVPLWILGSSLYGAQLAAALGLPYAFASHFAPAAMDAAIELYRRDFKPSAQLDKPYLMLGFNVCAAETDAQAHYLRSSMMQSVVRLRSGTPGQLPPPQDDYENTLQAFEKEIVKEFFRYSAVGSAQTISRQVDDFLKRTGADELMCTCSIYDHAARLRSFEIVAEIMQLQ